VEYVKLTEIRVRQLLSKDLPFLKRYAFEHECEFRMIYESEADEVRKLDIAVPLSCIDKITLSPWIHPDLSEFVKQRLHSIDGCSALRILRSTLIGNEEWKELGEAAI